MINFKKISNIRIDSNDKQLSYRSSAFGIYRNLLNKFDSKDLLLLESLGPGSSDSRTSLIGINPVLKIEVSDLIISIYGCEQLLQKVQALYSNEAMLDSSASLVRYQLKDRKAIWEFLRALDSQFESVKGGILAFVAFAYNTIYYIEDIAGYLNSDIPDISLTCYSTYLEFEDHRVRLHEYEFIGTKSICLADIDSYLFQKDVISATSVDNTFWVDRETLKSSYLLKAERALRHVQIGDVYQIQIGQKITIRSDISSLDVYARLRLLNPSPYMYLFECGRFQVIGASPELFVYMKDSELLMRPIAGTLGKYHAASKDDAVTDFRENSKEIAEHMMLVDLCRNDLCRVSEPNSLNVTELMSVEEYSHVFHMVSKTTSIARIDCDKFDVIQAAFPAGTMTGTPKISAIELISEIEDSSRGLYAGALGVIGLGINFVNTALCIRTAIKGNGVFSLRASAGIVADSVIQSEHDETLHKMGSVFKAITNEEISCHVM